MAGNLRWRIPVALVVVAWAAWFAFPLSERINLGLDLQGGMHLVLRVDTSELPADVRDRDVTAVALEIIRNRIDQFGVSEPLIQRQGVDHILVQLPGVTDRDRALKLIGETAMLEFKLVSENQRLIARALKGDVPRGFELVNDVDGVALLLDDEGGLTGEVLADAFVQAGDLGLPEVNFRMTRDGARKFGRMTGANINRRMAIVLDGIVQSSPVIQSRISDSGRITGRFTRQEANDLAIVLRAGALPAPIVIEEERTVGSTLGADSIRAGLTAIALGAVLVLVFMVGYYWLAGLVAALALTINVLMILGGLGYFHATLTLPGIAGMILTLGMAVDANVLIYERIREELTGGRPLGAAIRVGYERASTAIVDSNITTLVAAFCLGYFGTGPVRGFALTLGIGILASLFTALLVSRIILELMVGWGLKGLPMMHLIGRTKIDFVGKRKLCFVVSLVAVIIGISAYVMRGDDRYGIDFTGGVLQEYRFSEPVEAETLRETLRKVGQDGAILQQFGEPTEWLIKMPGGTEAEIQETIARTQEVLRADYAGALPELLRLERVGPTVGGLLRQKAWLAILWSLGGILLYIAVRFRHFEFGLAALIALAHDVILTAGALCLTGREIDLVIVAALMTIAGYSVNDTIVIYDRVRENLKLNRKTPFAEIVNMSINQTLARTLLTTFTTLLVVMALFFTGGAVLHNFAFALIVGFLAGIYSTIYVATALVIMCQRFVRPKVA